MILIVLIYFVFRAVLFWYVGKNTFYKNAFKIQKNVIKHVRGKWKIFHKHRQSYYHASCSAINHTKIRIAILYDDEL